MGRMLRRGNCESQWTRLLRDFTDLSMQDLLVKTAVLRIICKIRLTTSSLVLNVQRIVKIFINAAEIYST